MLYLQHMRIVIRPQPVDISHPSCQEVLYSLQREKGCKPASSVARDLGKNYYTVKDCLELLLNAGLVSKQTIRRGKQLLRCYHAAG